MSKLVMQDIKITNSMFIWMSDICNDKDYGEML